MSWFRRLGVATLKDGITPVLCVGAGVSASTATAVLCDKQSDAEDLARLKARGPPPPPQGTSGGRYYLRWCDNFDYTGHPDARRWNSQVESNNWVRVGAANGRSSIFPRSRRDPIDQSSPWDD